MAVATHPRRAALPLPGGRDGATVTVHPLVVAEMAAPPRFWDRGRSRARSLAAALLTPRSRWLPLPIPAFLVEHPAAGPILVDTGFAASVATKPSESLGRAVGALTTIRMTPEQAVPAQLRARGVDPEDVRLILMTHLHFDHASGIEQFPHATFLVDRAEWDAAAAGGLADGYHRRHFDRPYDWRYVDFASREVDSYATFGRAVDVLGDGSIRLVQTPGHTAGHMSVILRLSDRELLLTGDAAYSRRTIDERQVPLVIAGDEHHYRRSLEEIARYLELHPDAGVVCGHDPWDRAALDRAYR
jgi:N-acyl homoserine lactone hydrolase